MDERDLIRRLEELAPPDLDGSRERAKLAARVGLSKGVEGHRAFTRDRRGWRRLAASGRASRQLAALLACLVIGLVIAFTGPGRAVANWVGHAIGLGRPGGVPTLHSLRRQLDQATVARGAPAYVLARGPAPHGGHYEFLAYLADTNHAPCFELDLPEATTTAGGSCGVLLQDGRSLHIDSAGGGSDEVPIAISGRAGMATHSVEISVRETTIDAELTTARHVGREKVGLKRPFKIFVAFPESNGFEHGGRVAVTSRDTDGNILAVRFIHLADIATAYSVACEHFRLTEQVRKALKACAKK